MIELLAKTFIKNRDDGNAPAVRAAYGTLCSLVAIAFNVLLFAAKFLIGKAAGSVAITADAVNNLTDALSSVLVLLGFRLSNKKPDPDHPFGHGRIEYVAGLVVAGLILMTGTSLLSSAVEKLRSPEAIECSVAAVTVLALSIAVKFYMAAFTSRIGKKIESSAMEATAADYRSDSISTAVVLLCMLIFRFTGRNFDAVGGMVVALLILKTGIEEAKNTLSPLLGEKPDPALPRRVEEIVCAFPEVVGIHDLIVHDYGPGRLYISVHAEVDGTRDVFVLHDAMDRAMLALDAALGCESVIHMDPVDLYNEELNSYKNTVAEIVTGIDPVLRMHDFRMVPGPTHTNLVFDVLAPMGYALSDGELTDAIKAQVSARYEHTFCVIKVDKAYV